MKLFQTYLMFFNEIVTVFVSLSPSTNGGRHVACCVTSYGLHLRVSSRIVQLWGGGAASVPLCSHPRYTRWARGGGGGGYASTDLIGPVGSARPVLQFMAVR